MSFVDGLPADFAISDTAKTAIADLRNEYLQDRPHDPPMVLWVGWGIWHLKSGEIAERPMVGYYCLSEFDDVRAGIETVSGIDLIYPVVAPYHRHFSGKVLDWSRERGFFLREP